MESKENTSVGKYHMLMGNIKRTGFYPEKIDPPLKLTWKCRVGKDYLTGPVVKDGVVYVGSMDTYMYAIDLWKGKLIWKFQVDKVREDSMFWEHLDCMPEDEIKNHITTTPCLSKDKIFFGTIDGSVYALDITQQGKMVWKINIGKDLLYSSPLYLDGKVFFGSNAKKIHCVDSEKGDILLEIQLDNLVDNAVTIKDKTLFVTSKWEKGYPIMVYAIDIDSQQIKWKNEVKEELLHTHCVDDENLYVCVIRDGVYAFDIHTGKINWKFETLPVTPPSTADGIVYFANNTGNVFALNARDGSVVWKSDKEGGFDKSPPIITKNTIYIGGGWGNFLYGYDRKTGREIWMEKVVASVKMAATVSCGRLIFTDGAGYVYCFEEGEEEKAPVKKKKR